MNVNNVARVVKLNLEGEEYFGLEIPQEVLESMELVDGEILDAVIENNSLVLKRTGIISNGN